MSCWTIMVLPYLPKGLQLTPVIIVEEMDNNDCWNCHCNTSMHVYT